MNGRAENGQLVIVYRLFGIIFRLPFSTLLLLMSNLKLRKNT